MTIAPVVPKIAKLLPRLATDSDGECIATVRAIKRTLTSAGADLHDLAKLLSQSVDAPTGFDDHPPPFWVELTYDDRRRWLLALMRNSQLLSDWECSFVHDIAAKIAEFGSQTSPKQSNRLTQIIAKAWAWGVRP